MKNLRILEASELGHGILVEADAGWVSPKDSRNEKMLREAKDMDYRNPFEFYAVLQKYKPDFFAEKVARKRSRREGLFIMKWYFLEYWRKK